MPERKGDAAADLSIFIDESGDAMDGKSRYYLVSFVMHNQGIDFVRHETKYTQALADSELDDIPFHMSPIMNGHDEFENEEIEERKRRLSHFGIFAEHFPFHYHVFRYEKRHFKDGKALGERMRRDLTGFLMSWIDEARKLSEPVFMVRR